MWDGDGRKGGSRCCGCLSGKSMAWCTVYWPGHGVWYVASFGMQTFLGLVWDFGL